MIKFLGPISVANWAASVQSESQEANVPLKILKDTFILGLGSAPAGNGPASVNEVVHRQHESN